MASFFCAEAQKGKSFRIKTDCVQILSYEKRQRTVLNGVKQNRADC